MPVTAMVSPIKFTMIYRVAKARSRQLRLMKGKHAVFDLISLRPQKSTPIIQNEQTAHFLALSPE